MEIPIQEWCALEIRSSWNATKTRATIAGLVSHRFSGAFLVAMLLSGLAHSTAYYIDNSSASCNDGGAHSKSQPWCDFTTFNTTTFQPGDAIYLKAGDSWNQAVTLNGSGSASGAIKLTSYGTGPKPKISYGNGSPGTDVILGTNISYWAISGLEIEDTSTVPFDPTNQTPTSSAILIYYDGTGPYSNLTISGNQIHGTGTDQNNFLLYILASYSTRSTTVATRITINDNTIYDGGVCLVCVNGVVNGKNMTYLNGGYLNLSFTGNTVYNSALQGVQITAVTNGTIQDNLVHDTGQYVGSGETWGPVALWTLGCSHTTLQDNEVYNSSDGSTANDAAGIDVDWDNSYVTVQSNYLHDNQGPGIEVLSSDHTSLTYNRIYNNEAMTENKPGQISLDDFGDGVLHGITNATIAHNVIVLDTTDSTGLSTHGTSGYSWTADSYNNNYVLFSQSNWAYDLEIDGYGVIAKINANKFYSGNGIDFSGTNNAVTYNSLSSWRSSTGFDAASTETTGTSVSQERADFTPAGHTANQWTYLYSTDGESSFLGMSWKEATQQWNGSEPYCLVGAGWEQPGGISCDAVLTWTAENAGTATIGADLPITVQAACGGSGVRIRILQNDAQIWPSSGWESLANGAKYVFSHVTTALSAQDQLHFVIQHLGSNNDCDATYWIPTVVFHP
jgi:parallel beta-helix repeat protein